MVGTDTKCFETVLWWAQIPSAPKSRSHALALSLPLSLSLSVGFVKGTDRTWKGKKKKISTMCSKDSS